MFMGEYQHTIDAKGRIILPAKFREQLGERFIATKGLDNCLFVYPLSEWAILENKLKQLPLGKPEARAFVRFFFAGASEMELDKQGRILLPINLRSYGKLEKDVTIIGVSNRIELWDTMTWQEYSGNIEPTVEEVSASLIDFGI